MKDSLIEALEIHLKEDIRKEITKIEKIVEDITIDPQTIHLGSLIIKEEITLKVAVTETITAQMIADLLTKIATTTKITEVLVMVEITMMEALDSQMSIPRMIRVNSSKY